MLLVLPFMLSPVSAEETYNNDHGVSYLRMHVGAVRFLDAPPFASQYGYLFGVAYEWPLWTALDIRWDGGSSIHSSKQDSTFNVNNKKLFFTSSHLSLVLHTPSRSYIRPLVLVGIGMADARLGSDDHWFGELVFGGGVDFLPTEMTFFEMTGMKLSLETRYRRSFNTSFPIPSGLEFYFSFGGDF